VSSSWPALHGTLRGKMSKSLKRVKLLACFALPKALNMSEAPACWWVSQRIGVECLSWKWSAQTKVTLRDNTS
jgi:hypothetical protein